MDYAPPFAAGDRVPRTEELRHDLFKIEYLLTTLRSAPSAAAAETYDIGWLRGRQRFLSSVLAARRALQAEKIVDLAAWRRTGFAKEESLAA